MRISATLLPVLLLTGCASSPLPFGDARSHHPLPDSRSFLLEDESQAGNAVRQALLEAGFEESPAGGSRIEVGFVVRPARLSLSAAQDDAVQTVISPKARRSLSFCRKQAYVLTIAFVDRATGKVTSRRGATAGRCSGDAQKLLPELARTALAVRDEPRRTR